MDRRGPPRRADAAANREAVLDAAERVIRRDGTSAALDVIAREAGVGIGTLYRNFGDRGELLAAVTHRAYALVADLAAEAEHSDAAPLEAVGHFLARTIEERARLILPLLGGPGPRRGQVDPLGERITASLTAVLQRGIDDGTIRGDAGAIDVIVAGAMLAQAQLPDPSWQQVATRHARILLDGLRAARPSTTLPEPLSREQLDEAMSVE